MKKAVIATGLRSLTKNEMKQLKGGAAQHAWVCGAKRTIYYKKSECKATCTAPDECIKFIIE